ncbi:Kef-type K+ transport system membrane component KefB [Natranaerovirga hydrolytica]|uniref:Kef-type K+ transport system membrane component KefB n=2 Tax=Natranaerovirga hydrolytica TaxID=680378 RepID=A0A4R1MJ08_9FIRM|nr:Kef-type K+ transport system membrane component KefB [Natranaerovirga hydrolytica]
MNFENMLEAALENQFLIEIAFILLMATIGGWIATIIKMPAVLGQIVVGILLGPTLFDLINGHNEIIRSMADIGVIFLMFMAGLETDLKELKRSGKQVSTIAMGGVILPMLLGTLIPFYFFNQYIPNNGSIVNALYIGAILTATSVSISVSVLRDMKQLSGKQGVTILGSAIIDDVLAIIILAVVTGLVAPGEAQSIGILTSQMIIFFVASIILGYMIIKTLNKFAQMATWRDRIVIISVIVCFFFAFVSEMFSVAGITGAYIAGVIFSVTSYRHKVATTIQTMAYNLFTPIFFVSIGLKTQITSEVFDYLGYAIIIVIIAIVSKILGAGIGAKVSQFTTKESLQIGVGMIARAEVALIVATQGLLRGIISDPTFTSIVLLVVISTIITPPLLKYLFKDETPKEVL